MSVPSGTFAEACYDMNSIEELTKALQGPADPIDCETWKISSDEWRRQIEIALTARLQDAS